MVGKTPPRTTRTMRKRSVGERLLPNVTIISNTAVAANCAQAPREKVRKRPARTMSSIRPLHSGLGRVSIRWKSRRAGNIRKAPSTLGSLKVPRARSYSRKRSEALPSVDRVRAWSDERKVALENHVDELRQLINGSLADESADPGDARVATLHQPGGRRIALIRMHGAELVDFDQLVVEAVALLLEENGAAAVELDRNCSQQHDGGGEQENDAADNLVEQPLHDHVPVGNRLVEHIQHGHAADIGIGARAIPQLVGMRGQPDIDRQHPQLFQHLQDAAFRR